MGIKRLTFRYRLWKQSNDQSDVVTTNNFSATSFNNIFKISQYKLYIQLYAPIYIKRHAQCHLRWEYAQKTVRGIFEKG